ncbi:DUF4202 domain-containing protein [Corallincola holothuriorum]|uniref:DUF4202 domain-containing protein n=1 Tax=Corallincola holothuriorum TaxID=2282215 RepID=A0A368NNC8_9GAMM|nr:DUF4202 domain-containing protein [Corallincola holothuriorum]RCU50811.1 DUF4202 domain-containing protein [Corallincola holothuriorum]
MDNNSALDLTLEAIDQVNSQDPNMEFCHEVEVPKELLYGQRMSERLAQFAPGASEHLQIAARAQHIKRWAIPRSDYPMDRQGYHQWRTDLGKMHADLAAELMREQGYSEDDAVRTQQLLRKEKIKRDAECQTLEDVICLVFLEYYFADFAAKHTEEKMLGIIRKTWAKMSEAGHAAALELDLPEAMLALVKRALS